MLKSQKIAQAFFALATVLDNPRNQHKQLLVEVALYAGASLMTNFLGYRPLWSNSSSI